MSHADRLKAAAEQADESVFNMQGVEEAIAKSVVTPASETVLAMQALKEKKRLTQR
jgi:hypothetical protein